MKRKIIGIFLMMIFIFSVISPLAVAEKIEQSQEICDETIYIPGEHWQEIIPIEKTITKVEVYAVHWFGGSPDLKLSIEKPLGSILTFKELPVSAIGDHSPAWTVFDVPDISVNPGQSYFVKLTAPLGSEYGWGLGYGNPYLQGASSHLPDDFCFRIWSAKGRSKELTSPFLRFLENNPYLFPLLKQILGL